MGFTFVWLAHERFAACKGRTPGVPGFFRGNRNQL